MAHKRKLIIGPPCDGQWLRCQYVNKFIALTRIVKTHMEMLLRNAFDKMSISSHELATSMQSKTEFKRLAIHCIGTIFRMTENVFEFN
jgi:hypothetical protein